MLIPRLFRRVFPAFLMFFALSLDASAEELSSDKFGHFQAFYGVGVAVEGVGGLSWPEKTVLGLAPGIAKELLDSASGGSFDMHDIAFDALGMLAALLSSDTVLVIVRDNRTVVLTIMF